VERDALPRRNPRRRRVCVEARERQKPRASDALTRMLVGLAHIDKHELAARNARLQVARGDLEEGRSWNGRCG
jgi:hypothetical protein